MGVVYIGDRNIGKTALDKPKVEEDRVTLRIKVRKEEQRLALNLQKKNFEVVVDGEEPGNILRWQNPKATTPPPARIIILLDQSGSMKELDKLGKRKIEGAVRAIEGFLETTEDRGGDTKIAIVPFWVPGLGCSKNYPVNKKTLDNFFPPGDVMLKEQL